jgi:hypothetical protein
LIKAVRESDHARVAALLDGGCDIHERGDQGWPALNFAAGKGDGEIVRRLIDKGADVWMTGADGRTPYQIAAAASHTDVAALLRAREEELGGDTARISSREWEARPYCRGYFVKELRDYAGWVDGDAALPDDTVVFVHADYSVTRSFWAGEDILFAGDSPEWRTFCTSVLRFSVPRDID